MRRGLRTVLASALLAVGLAQPAYAQQSRFQVVPGVLVDIQGDYPPGLAPGWSIAGASLQVPADWESHVGARVTTRRQTVQLRLVDSDGRPALLFGGYCLAVLSDKPVVIGSRPTVSSCTISTAPRPIRAVTDARR